MVGGLDSNFGWADGRLLTGRECEVAVTSLQALRGAFACARGGGGRSLLVRDPLGINKLFWAADEAGNVLVAARPCRLIEAGCAFEDVYAVSAGAAIEIDWEGRGERVRLLRSAAWQEPVVDSGNSVEVIATRIRSTLDRYCAALADAHPGAEVFVCLSGGLDSSGIAVLARTYFSQVTAVSFDLERGGAPPSADRSTAERLARDLGLPLLAVTVTENRLLEGLDVALAEGIDWRDFNVHAALVNVALARGIAEAGTPGGPGRPSLVLTGDLANEYLCDYHPEHYRGRTYYPLPRLPPAAIRRALVRGLDTSHREIGPFQAWGLPVVQPYAPAVDHYLGLPEAFLGDPQRKERLSRLVFRDQIPDYVYTRPKTRAQVGDADTGRGVLAVCVDRGIDQDCLQRRFAELHRVTDAAALQKFLRAGRYRSSIPRPQPLP